MRISFTHLQNTLDAPLFFSNCRCHASWSVASRWGRKQRRLASDQAAGPRGSLRGARGLSRGLAGLERPRLPRLVL